ncbi:Uncharacterised protein [Vibrio cholerae]|uniref:Uncharacterized protein n=1 Tax=Vibrio cholerae TaxID=666 RepID=A0A655RNG1_VIBCL|nr:Uncharacterised protein [Vibrio cholerae]
MGEIESAERRVVSKTVHAIARGVHQHGGRSVNHITGSDLFIARLQKIFLRRRCANWRNAAVNRENCPHRYVDIDIGRAV